MLATTPRSDIVTEIKSPTLIYLKGTLFLMLGVLASVLLLLQAPNISVALLLGLCVWAFCRFYYFAFYVIHHYVDATYRFAGLMSFLCYAIGKRRQERQTSPIN